MPILRIFLILGTLAALNGCNQTSHSENSSSGSANTSARVLLSVTSDATQHPQSVDMAIKLAGFALDEGRPVVIFFNVKGVKIPTNEFPADLAFQENKPIKEQLVELIDRGADVHVCPICMKPLGVVESDLLEGAKVTTRPSLFANLGADTVVFTY